MIFFKQTSFCFLFVSMAIGLLTNSLYSQDGSSADKVDIEVKLSHEKVKQEGGFGVAIILDIKEPWHLNAHEPTLEYLIGTEITFDPREGYTLNDVTYPEPESYEFDFVGGEELKVYGGKTIIFENIKIKDKLRSGSEIIGAEITLQACDKEVCLPPQETSIEIPFEVAGSGEEVSKINEDLFSDYHLMNVNE